MSFSQKRTVRVAIPALAAAATASVAVTWTPPLPGTAYSLNVEVFDPAGLANVTTITAKTAGGCSVGVKNIGLTSLLVGTATLEVTAIYD